MFISCNICILSFELQVNNLIKQMFDLIVFIIYWSSFKHLLKYIHVFTCNDEFFMKWKKLWAELNVCKTLMLQSCFCMIIILNFRISLFIKNDSWIFNNFLILYCRICRKNWFIIKLFAAVVNFTLKLLFICFQSLRVFCILWFNVFKFAQILFSLNH